MVKHAANKKAPLLTAEERVDAAVQRFAKDKDLSDEQLEWLKRIRTHLVQNLSIDKDDFNVVPIFTLQRRLGPGEQDVRWQALPGASTNSMRRSRHDGRRPASLGLLPHPSP